jgi:LIM domain
VPCAFALPIISFLPFNLFVSAQKPFPDKSFYVFDGKPLCAYHYHEANDSLCAAATCGQPIEGPCAVSHVGDRYHPQHLTCEYPGNPKCMEKLEEYYEVDGRMLCERHANTAKREDEDDDDDERWRSINATKRRTKFMNLGEESELQ